MRGQSTLLQGPSFKTGRKLQDEDHIGLQIIYILKRCITTKLGVKLYINKYMYIYIFCIASFVIL